jgi:hypothetical protein
VNATFYFTGMQVQCQRCSHPDAAVVSRTNLVALLEEARKLTHPDVCTAEAANAVTARINATLDSLKLK